METLLCLNLFFQNCFREMVHIKADDIQGANE